VFPNSSIQITLLPWSYLWLSNKAFVIVFRRGCCNIVSLA
jgi:hypothetical protein